MSNKSFPHITIAVINFNGLRYLKQSIPFLIRQKYPNFDILVIDNYSKDGSREYLNIYSKIRLILNETEGSKNRALNLGIKDACGEYILFLDNDIVLDDDNLLYKLLKEFKKHSDIGLLSLTLINKNEDKIYFYGEYLNYFSFIRKNKRVTRLLIKKINGEKIVGVQGAGFFAKKEIFNLIGIFDETVPFGGEDVDVGIRSILFGFNNYIYSNSLAIHVGMDERSIKIKYRNKYFWGNVGLFITILKNYSLQNLFFSLILFFPYQFLKTVKDSIIKKDPILIIKYFLVIIFLLNNKQLILKQRKIIQSKRVIKEDIFLRIEPPKFD